MLLGKPVASRDFPGNRYSGVTWEWTRSWHDFFSVQTLDLCWISCAYSMQSGFLQSYNFIQSELRYASQILVALGGLGPQDKT